MIKKIFTMVLVFTTVLWSLGIASIMPAFAATISAGDLIKASGAAVYYYGSDGMRYVFPNQATYMSWYSDFSTVKTITDAELAAIEMNGNVTVRPGTKLVKITTDPKTYAVTPGGVLRHIDSEARAIALYGSNWASKIVDVSDAFWVNYKKGAVINSDINPDGSLVKYSGSATIYYIEDGMKRAVSDFAFTANMFKMADVVTISDSITYSNGDGLTTMEAAITNVAGGASSSTTSGSGLTVALASDTPTTGIVVANAVRIPFTKVNLTASADGDVTVDHIVIQRTGLAQDAAFSSFDLVDAATGLTINSTSKTLNSSHQATFTNDFVVKAGTTRSIIVAANMGATSNYAGETPIITVVDVATTGGATVTGSLPISGNYQNVNGSITIGTATIQRGAYTNATSTSIEVGKEDYTFFSFQIAAGSAEKVAFSQVKVYQEGSATLSSDTTNLELLRDGVKLANGVIDGKYVSFTFSEVVLDKGQTAQFLVRADVTDGSARTIDFGIYRTTDLIVKGLTYGYNITPTYSGTGSSTANPVLSDNTFTISTGSLTVSKSNTIGATDIAVADNQTLGAFQFTAKGEPVDVTAFTLTMSSSTLTSAHMTNVRLVDSSNNVLAGPTDVTTAGNVSLADTFTVPVGDNVYRVIADLEVNSGWATNETISVDATTITAEGTVTGLTVTASGAGSDTNTQTVKTGKLVVTRDTLPADSNIIIGQNDVKLGSWTFDANDSGEDVRITTIALAASTSAATNLTLKANGVALDPVMVKPTEEDDGATTTFALSTPLIVKRGTQTTVTLEGDIESSATANDSTQYGITDNAAITAYGVATGSTINATVTADNGAVLTYLGSGTLTISTSSNPPTGIVIAGSTGNTVTKVRLQAKNENLDLNKLTILIADGGSDLDGTNGGTYQDIVSVSLYDGATLLGSHSLPSTGLYQFTFPTGTLTIPDGGEKIITVKADIATIDSSADNAPGTVAADFKLGIGGTDGIQTTGVQSNTVVTTGETYQGSTSSAMVIHKSKPTVTLAQSGAALGAATTLTGGSQALFAFKVSADAANEVLLYRATFQVATSGCTVSSLSIRDEYGNVIGAAADTVGEGDYHYYTATFNNPDISAGDLKEAIEVSAGGSKTFFLWGNSASVSDGDYVAVTLLGDSATTTVAAMGTTGATGVNIADNYSANNQGNFVWSDNATNRGLDTDGANATAYGQWYNGYRVSGLGVSPTTSSYVISN